MAASWPGSRMELLRSILLLFALLLALVVEAPAFEFVFLQALVLWYIIPRLPLGYVCDKEALLPALT